MTIRLSPFSVFKLLLSTILLLLGGNILAIYFKFNSQHEIVLGAAQIFDFNREVNIPSIYSALTLLLCALLLFYVFWAKQFTGRSLYKWLVLSLIFLFLAFDEFSSFHEKIMVLLRDNYDLSGVFYYAWIVPYGIAVLLLGVAYVPFILKLPAKIRKLFLISGSLFITGAVGLEILGGQQDEIYGTYNLVYALLYTVEELLEMLGIALFIYALLLYISDFTNFESISIKLSEEDKTTSSGRARISKASEG